MIQRLHCVLRGHDYPTDMQAYWGGGNTCDRCGKHPHQFL